MDPGEDAGGSVVSQVLLHERGYPIHRRIVLSISVFFGTRGGSGAGMRLRCAGITPWTSWIDGSEPLRGGVGRREAHQPSDGMVSLIHMGIYDLSILGYGTYVGRKGGGKHKDPRPSMVIVFERGMRREEDESRTLVSIHGRGSMDERRNPKRGEIVDTTCTGTETDGKFRNVSVGDHESSSRDTRPNR